jgi:hypothetical protein
MSAKMSPKNSSPTTTTSSTRNVSNSTPVEDVEVVEDRPQLPLYTWDMNDGLYRNFDRLGQLLASLPGLQLYQTTENDGLIHVASDKVRRIATAKELAPLLIDNVVIAVIKNGKYHGDRVSEATLGNMLHATSFLRHFKVVRDAVTTPVILLDDTASRPGYNAEDGILYLGQATAVGSGMDKINTFLDVMEWQSNADRTNAVAAFLTVPFRHRWPGGKPFILVTANKSHAGKTTICEFINIDRTATARIEYGDQDWAMQNQLYTQLMLKPEIGIVSFDNVRTDSSGGRTKVIRSGYVESFVTSAEVVIGRATAHKAVWAANKFVVMLNSNEGSLSIDLLNRSLPIRLAPTGDVTQRRSPIGNPKLEYLPVHRREIEAERWGMIDRWVKAGRPLDESVAHYPMGPWAKVIGGILLVNGLKDFLGNYSATRFAADPIREALGILAFHNAGIPKRAGELVKSAVKEGLVKTLLPGVDQANEGATVRALGHFLKKYAEETFVAHAPSDTGCDKITYRLVKKQGRFGEPHPHYRYLFEEISRETVTEEPQGLELEMPGIVGLPDGFRPSLGCSPTLQPPVAAVPGGLVPELHTDDVQSEPDEKGLYVFRNQLHGVLKVPTSTGERRVAPGEEFTGDDSFMRYVRFGMAILVRKNTPATN